MYDLKIISYIAATLACLALLYAASAPKRTGVFFAGGMLWTSSPKDALEQAAGILNVPWESLVLESTQLHPPQTQYYHSTVPQQPFSAGLHRVLARPVRGDHYHQHLVFRINGVQMQPWHDVESLRGVPWDDPASVRCGSHYAYHSARGLHVGFHTHCDGIAHSHPWTAPYALKDSVGGMGHTTGLLLDALGVEYGPREPPNLQLPNRDSMPSNSTHTWQLIVCRGGMPVLRVREHLDRVWYPVHGAALVFSYGTHSDACNVSLNRLPAAHGFDNHPYPELF